MTMIQPLFTSSKIVEKSDDKQVHIKKDRHGEGGCQIDNKKDADVLYGWPNTDISGEVVAPANKYWACPKNQIKNIVLLTPYARSNFFLNLANYSNL